MRRVLITRGPFLVRHPNVGIGLPILEHDVVSRLMPLDEFVFKDQRLSRIIRPYDLEVRYLRF